MDPSPRTLSPALRIATLVVFGCIFVALATLRSRADRPWCDEAWLASPAYNLATQGHMGTAFLEPADPAMPGIERFTYWVLPLYPVTLAGWFETFGFSLDSMRAMSAAWGVVLLLSVYALVKSLTGDERPALLSYVFLSVDFALVRGAATGRMDTMGAALVFASLAVFASCRVRRFLPALLVANSVAALACLTHPNGILAVIGLGILVDSLDRGRLKPRVIVACAIPYIAALAAWAAYALREPDLFLTQFNANLTGRGKTFLHPWDALCSEIAVKWIGATGAAAVSLKSAMLAGYVAGFCCVAASPSLRARPSSKILLWLCAVYVAVMFVVDGRRLYYYIVYNVPLFVALLAVWLASTHFRGAWLRRGVVLGIVALLAIHVAGTLYVIRRDTASRDLAPVVDYLRSHADERNNMIMASAELAFPLGFDANIVDDIELGYYSGRRPDWIVVDAARYGRSLNYFERAKPATFEHARRILKDNYREVYRTDSYRIYESVHYAANATK